MLDRATGGIAVDQIADDRVLKYLPELFRQVKDYQAIAHTESIELDQLQAALQQAFDNQFVLTSDEKATARREKMLGIQADPQVESLDFRKRRILNRYRTKPPFTVRYLQRLLDRLVGEGMTIVSVDVEQFVLYVTTNVEHAEVFREVIHTIETVKPANLAYQQNTSLMDVVGLEEHIRTQEVTWNYVLDGSWKLGEKSFSTLGDEVAVV